ncbi:MAG: peptidase M29 [Chloroflexi bacterium RBG_16_57_11]|nr:MAG: peptidase M29 [Chloroflexi bacterium RBG_16_57_11]
MAQNFEDSLQKYADIIVRIGLNLRVGQSLMVTAPVQSASLVQKIAASAYQAGCRYVDVMYLDELVKLARHKHAPRDSFEEYPTYLSEGILQHTKNGGAYLRITGEDPDLLNGQDPDLVALAERTARVHLKPFYELLHHNGFNWAIAGYPSLSWARAVFPGKSHEEQEQLLWDALFKVCRIDQPDPIAAWQSHIAGLVDRREYLTQRQYQALHLIAPDTDLTIGLSERHRWMGGSIRSETGIDFVPNLPTEEVFTMPHRQRIDGQVTATKPLSYSGSLIEDFCLTFSEGRVTSLRARRGEETLRKMIELDGGMASLGEVALVSHSSPVSQSGMLFFNTLLDENAACHIALGSGFHFCLQDGESVSEEEYARRGGNTSLGHTDFMIGSAEIDVDGLLPDGVCEPVMRHGEWAFQL